MDTRSKHQMSYSEARNGYLGRTRDKRPVAEVGFNTLDTTLATRTRPTMMHRACAGAPLYLRLRRHPELRLIQPAHHRLAVSGVFALYCPRPARVVLA